MELPQYGSPRGPSLVSPGLTLRTGKTPRPEPGVQQGPASRAFEFHDFQQVSRAGERQQGLKRPARRTSRVAPGGTRKPESGLACCWA